MKHDELALRLGDYLALAGIQTTPRERDSLARHIELVIEANARVNLTRIVEPMDAVRLHTGDSLAVLEDVEAGPAGRLLDLGSGAGFPGIPLAICTRRSVLLLDSVGKKVKELEWMIAQLSLAGRVFAVASRAEELARTEPAGFSVVTARAVSELPALVELASPLLSSDGLLIAMKGSPGPAEVERSHRVAEIAGLRQEYQRSFDLPEEAGRRSVFCYRKVGASRVALPRREGSAQHSPLA